MLQDAIVRKVRLSQGKEICTKVSRKRNVPCSLGCSGIGKSELMQQIRRRKQWLLIDLRLALGPHQIKVVSHRTETTNGGAHPESLKNLLVIMTQVVLS